MNKLIPTSTLPSICARCTRPRALLVLPRGPLRVSPIPTSTSPSPSPSTPSHRRPFTTTPFLSKKNANKATKTRDAPDSFASTKSSTIASEAANTSPDDFSDLEANIAKAHAQLKDDLSKLRAGGRFNPEVVENLRVALSKDAKETVRLGDLCQVVPRGRVLQVLVGEKEHIKPISSAILTSDLSLTPQPDASNALQLNIPLPPPTKDSRQLAVTAANKAGDKASDSIRNARQAQQKRLRAMGLAKSARPDDLKKAGDKMEKVVQKGEGEVKRVVEAARKVLESG